MKLEEISIVVPTKNEENNISRFLKTVPPEVHLIIVDSSSDHTPLIVQRERPKNTTIIQQEENVSRKRQIGAEAAKTKWLVFSDGDVNFAPDFFHIATKYNYPAFYGSKRSKDEYIEVYERYTTMQGMFHSLGIPAVIGSNMIIRKDVLEAIGGFDPNLTCNEDSEISFRLKKRGYQIEFIPELIVYAHDHRRIKKGVVTKGFHTFTRCALLYLDIMPEEWKKEDWGYWR